MREICKLTFTAALVISGAAYSASAASAATVTYTFVDA